MRWRCCGLDGARARQKKAVAPSKLQQRQRILPSRRAWLHHVADHEASVANQQPAKQLQQFVELRGREILQNRMQNHDFEGAVRQRRDLLRSQHRDVSLMLDAAHDGVAQIGRGFAQRQGFRLTHHPLGIGGFAAAVIEHAVAAFDMPQHAVAGDERVHLAVAGVDIDRMVGIEEGNPVGHAGLIARPWDRPLLRDQRRRMISGLAKLRR